LQSLLNTVQFRTGINQKFWIWFEEDYCFVYFETFIISIGLSGLAFSHLLSHALFKVLLCHL
jgi:hypothetical protein